jgi:hypothetical protein
VSTVSARAELLERERIRVEEVAVSSQQTRACGWRETHHG